jgi:purine-nucleoside phosphorylase
MTSLYDRVAAAVDSLRPRLSHAPEVAVVLGSGLGDFGSRLTDDVEIPYGVIPGWPTTEIQGHAGRLVVGHLAGRPTAVLSGRTHVYEGHDMDAVTFGVRVMARLGVRVLVLTNAAGGINLQLAPGALMLIDDHLNLMGDNPLIGAHDARFGIRFPDMSEVYSSRLRAVAHEAADRLGVTLTHGVYAAVHGPSFETPAEIRYLRTIGADAVGMSTVPEAIVARQMGLDVVGISCITNMAAGIRPQPVTHDEVMETTRLVRHEVARLLEALVGGA